MLGAVDSTGHPPVPPASAPAGSVVHPRSCHDCHRRKVRCTKIFPCENCLRLGVKCTFPPPGRKPRKIVQGSKKAELVSRLNFLEQKVQHLSAQTTGEPQTAENHRESSERIESPPFTNPVPPHLQRSEGDVHPEQSNPPGTEALEHQFGRLLVDRGSGESRYVSNQTLIDLGDQIKEIHDLFDSASSPTFSEPEEDLSSPQSTSYSEPHSQFLFGNSVLVDSLLSYHPSPSSSHILLTIFEENIAPINSIIHKPSLRNLIQTACVTPELLDRGSEALVFSVYFAAASSMTSEQCIARLGEDRAALVKHYRFAVEQALARAGLLHTHKFIVLQAAVLFLTCACHPKDVQFIWAMIGLVARLGMGLGLHRDGSRFGLSPFETEMRRRLWWYIYLLDVQTSDFQATSPQIREGDYDTRLPLNLNDDDWSLEMVEPPQERSGFTEMTLTLVRCKILMTTRKLMQMTSATAGGPTELFQKRALAIEKAKESLHNTHLQYCDVTNPIHWVVATIGRVAISRLWLISHFSLLTAEGFDPNMWPNQCEILVTTAIEVLEFTYLLQTHENTAHWAWLFQGHVQWQSIAFVLSELCARPTFPSSDRAWTVINRIFEKWNHASIYKEGIIMRLLGRLKSRAVAVRDQLHVSDPTLPVESTEWAIPMSEFTPVQQPVLESLNAQTEALDIFRDVWSNIDLNPGDEIWG